MKNLQEQSTKTCFKKSTPQPGNPHHIQTFSSSSQSLKYRPYLPFFCLHAPYHIPKMESAGSDIRNFSAWSLKLAANSTALRLRHGVRKDSAGHHRALQWMVCCTCCGRSCLPSADGCSKSGYCRSFREHLSESRQKQTSTFYELKSHLDSKTYPTHL